MIIARNYTRIFRNCSLPSVRIIKFNVSCYDTRNNYTNIKFGSPSCRYRHFNVPLAAFKLDHANRTSTLVLENAYVRVASFYRDPSYKITKTITKASRGWACTISVKWPEPNEFTAEQSKKSEATRVASWLALEWLKSLNKLDLDGKPVLVENVRTTLNLTVNPEVKTSIQALAQKYERVKQYYDDYDKEHTEYIRYFDDCEVPSYKNLSPEEINDRNDVLYSEVQNLPPRIPLPVNELSQEIVETIENNRVVVIKGATGSGKTTRVPQLLMDFYCRNGNGAYCNILITQPRRISAVSLAARVASERNERLGRNVGYHVRFNVKYPALPGNIVFVSTGILLQRLLINPTLSDVSHVIIDEAHERDLNTDLLLMLMKELLKQNDKIKIVIMSATINAEFFQKYFDNCPTLSIPGKMYPVRTHYIDDPDMVSFIQNQDYENTERDINDELITNVIFWIHRTRPPGAVLVFLPGWADISSMREKLQVDKSLLVLSAHSKMKIEQQELIFETPEEGKRKVILGTNIAESSITIPDVVYVVDSGLMKSLGTFRGVKGLCNVWISKAVADQRMGRAGRITEGECFRLYSRNKYESFIEYPIPEVHRVSLESFAMRIKMYSDEKLLNILSMLPDKPSMRAINEAVRYLTKIGVFDSTENLTPLGRRIAMIGLHPLLSISLVYSVFFKCLHPMLFITSNLNGDGALFGIGMKKKELRRTLIENHPTNDNLAIYRIYRGWLMSSDLSLPNKLTESCYINSTALDTFKKVIELNMNYLFKAHLVSVNDIVSYNLNTFTSVNETMVAPTLLAATDRLAINAQPYQVTYLSSNAFKDFRDGKKVQIANESVNFKSTRDSTRFLTYCSLSTTEDGFLRIYGTAQVSSITALIFCPTLPNINPTENLEEYELMHPNVDFRIMINRDTLDHLLCLREMTWKSLNFFLTHFDSYIEEPSFLTDFKSQLITLLDSVVNQ